MMLGDALCVTAALYGAYALGFEFELTPHRGQILAMLLWYLPAKLAVFAFFGLYRGMWRYFSLKDAWRLLQAVRGAFMDATAALLYLTRFQSLSQAVFLMDAVLTYVLCSALRGFIRNWYASRMGSRAGIRLPRLKGNNRNGDEKCVLIVGAGQAGEKMLREILDNASLQFRVAGFLDDDEGKHGRTLHGAPVLGPSHTDGDVVQRFGVQEIFIAVPSATTQEMRPIMEQCKVAGVPVKTPPGIGALMDDTASTWPTWTPSATGAMPGTMCGPCGSCSCRTPRKAT